MPFLSIPRRLVSAAFFAATLVAGQGFAQAASGKLSFESGGQARSAFIVEHERLKRRLRATILILHGGSGSGLRTRRIIGLEDVIRSQGVVIVYPDAINGKWDLADDSHRDVQAIRDLIKKLVDERISDRKKIYLLGVTTGGILAMKTACENSDMVAGVGVLLVTMPPTLAASCKPSTPVPFFLLAGTADPLVPFAGGAANLREYKQPVASVEATLAPFLTAAGCSEKLSTTSFPDKDPNDGSRVFLDTFNNCKAPVELVRVEGGGHTLPGRWRGPEGGPAVGIHNNDVDSTKLIWEFLKRAGA